MNKNPEKIYKCKYCGQEFDCKRKLKGHITGKHKLEFCNICGKYITISNYNKHIKSCEKIHKSYYCEKCGKLVIKKFGSGKFCSRKCANSRVQTLEQNKLRSIKLKSNPHGFTSLQYKIKRKQQLINKICKYRENPNKCKICGKILDYNHKFNKVCSKTCLKLYLSNKTGGYREGSGRSNHGHYKGIYCASTYELVYLIYCLDNNIPIKKFDGCLIFDNDKYFPDFILNDVIIEIKGYKSSNLEKQIRVAKANNYKIEVKFKEDLKVAFNWVKTHYNYKKLSDLYDK